MNHSALTAAETAALSSLAYQPTPPGLRLAYSRTDVEDLVCQVARTRRQLHAARQAKGALTRELLEAAGTVDDLERTERTEMQRLNTYIDRLAGIVR